MASSVSLLIGVTILLLIVCMLGFSSNKNVEGFATQRYSVNNLEINTCPTYTNEIQTAKGKTDCCNGDMVDGKCHGKTFCTKSPGYDGVKPCVDAWRDYFTKKGIEFCPANMPNYFEDVTNPRSLRGCSASAIVKTGKAPTNAAMKQCRIYNTEAENKSKSNSCYLEKERLKIQCPVVNGKSPEAAVEKDENTNIFKYFKCTYPSEIDNTPHECNDEKTIKAHYDKTNPNWRTTNFTDVENALCKNYIARRQKYKEEQRLLAEEKRKNDALKKAIEEAKKKYSFLKGFFKFFGF